MRPVYLIIFLSLLINKVKNVIIVLNYVYYRYVCVEDIKHHLVFDCRLISNFLLKSLKMLTKQELNTFESPNFNIFILTSRRYSVKKKKTVFFF